LIFGDKKLTQARRRGVVAWLLSVVGIPVAIAVSFAVAMHWHWFPVCRLVANLSGSTIWIEPPEIKVGRLRAGSTVHRTVVIRNYSNHDIEIAGADASCGCTTASDIPCKIPAAGEAFIPIKVELVTWRTPGDLLEHIVFMVNDRGVIIKYPVSIRGEIMAAGDS
jgi:hypothetical protein